jgi:hypothetical protein
VHGTLFFFQPDPFCPSFVPPFCPSLLSRPFLSDEKRSAKTIILVGIDHRP